MYLFIQCKAAKYWWAKASSTVILLSGSKINIFFIKSIAEINFIKSLKKRYITNNKKKDSKKPSGSAFGKSLVKSLPSFGYYYFT